MLAGCWLLLQERCLPVVADLQLAFSSHNGNVTMLFKQIVVCLLFFVFLNRWFWDMFMFFVFLLIKEFTDINI